MSTKYKVRDDSKPYFITTTIVGWIDVFTNRTQREKLIESLIYCQKHKGLIIYSWCLMSNPDKNHWNLKIKFYLYKYNNIRYHKQPCET